MAARRKRVMWFRSSAAALLATFALLSGAAELPLSEFHQGSLRGWERRDFAGETRYTLADIDGRRALRADSVAAASALYRRQRVDLQVTPFLNWSWRVEALVEGADPLTKAGDDYAARVYVVVRRGLFPWQTRALNYVWAGSNAPALSQWPNPFTEHAVMIPLRRGDDGLGRWQQQRVNVAEDYYRAFGERIRYIDGVALMTDTDNGGGQARAYYGELYFSD